MESVSEKHFGDLHPEQALAMLDWMIELGIDEAISEDPIDRFSLAEKPAKSEPALEKRAQREKPQIARKTVELDPIELAEQAARSAADIAALKASLAAFEHCELKRGAKNLVFSDGVSSAPIMIVGDAPGREEDFEARPFVGPAGALIDNMLAAIDLSRDNSVYLTNVLPWRPPAGRDPRPDEIAVMKPFLERHIQLIAPKILILMGNLACQTVLGKRGMGRLRGVWHSAHGIAALPMVHPEYLLRNGRAKAEAWVDLLELAAKLEELQNTENDTRQGKMT